MTELRDFYDVAVVGAGPAGLAAANVCARAGLATVLFDEQPAPGGQIYRSVSTTPVKRDTILGADYWAGAAQAQKFLASGAQYVPGATVWNLTREREIGVSIAGSARLLTVERVILTTGALERPFPIAGWTLPGVMTAGAGQILLKSSGLIPDGRTVIAGCGPLLWLIAWQYLNAGARIDAILEAAKGDGGAAWRHAATFATSPYFIKGLRLMLAVRRRVRVVANVVELRAEGRDRVEAVAYRTMRGTEQRLPVDNLFLHQGVVPNVNLAMAAGIEHRWDDAQLCFAPMLDADGGTAISGIAIAGDGAGIAGAEAAQARGMLAGLAAVRALRPDAPVLAETEAVRGRLARFTRGRAFLDAYYKPAPQFRRPARDTLVCRCEEVTAGQIIDTVALGCTGPNQMKAFLRCGMGPCQGRECGLTVTELIAQARGVGPQEVGYYRLRPPVKPITLGELASLPKNETALRSVARG
ncbi:MAG: FAD-dependent oxidoreductase [Hyphomicrobiales bacterium]|nr:FAD-dependent oxidoreductase [Hyphomicrobiales bacterium]